MKKLASKKLTLIGGALSLIACAQAAQAHEVTYNVTQTFNQVVYDVSHPEWDTIFTGTFDYNEHTQTVSNLMGSLTQAMTGNAVSRQLTHQLSSVYDATLGGLLVTSFLQNSTDVFSGGGFASTGLMGPVYTYGNQNAYATIFVNTSDLTAALTQAQINKLAYGDCTPGSLMSLSQNICMAGWVKVTTGTLGEEILGAGGTMRGTYPITQSITAAVPEPETYAMMLAGLGLVGFMARGRKAKEASK